MLSRRPDIEADAARLRTLRRDLHAHPELAFAEERTSEIVAAELGALGLDTVRGLGGTGVVATIHGEPGSRAIGLRADMDALAMDEENSFDHRSTRPGRFHGCGHDGHTTMLLGAARHLASHRNFRGTVHLVFQPAEEAAGGARAMLRDGLLERFPMDAIYGLHNSPLLPAGAFATRSGPMLAAMHAFSIEIAGVGGHGAMPHLSVDPIVAAAHVIQALQTIVSRAIDPLGSGVVTVARIHAGDADNVIPAIAQLGGTIRYFDDAIGERIRSRMQEIVNGVPAAHGARGTLVFADDHYPPLVNTPAETAVAVDAAARLVGDARVSDADRVMGSEDFAWLLRDRPGCYMLIGNGSGPDSCMVHNPRYDFNDEILATGAAYWVELVERALPIR